MECGKKFPCVPAGGLEGQQQLEEWVKGLKGWAELGWSSLGNKPVADETEEETSQGRSEPGGNIQTGLSALGAVGQMRRYGKLPFMSSLSTWTLPPRNLQASSQDEQICPPVSPKCGPCGILF